MRYFALFLVVPLMSMIQILWWDYIDKSFVLTGLPRLVWRRLRKEVK